MARVAISPWVRPNVGAAVARVFACRRASSRIRCGRARHRTWSIGSMKGMASEPHGDGGDFRHLSCRRRRRPDRLRRHLRQYRAAGDNAYRAWRVSGRHLLFAIAPGVVWLFSARTLTGIGVGLTAGPSTAAVLEFATGASRRAALITMVAQAGGFTAALLLGSALVAIRAVADAPELLGTCRFAVPAASYRRG
jgi:hypothetical protein